jgi:tRNA (cmo5U34)-methyltransferase
MEQKSTTEEIRKRFDTDVERFSNLKTGQAAINDAPLAMELITQAAVACTSNIRSVLDIGCGAGNNTLKLLQYTSPFDCNLVDLGQPVLDKAYTRITEVNTGKIRTFQGDFRTIELPEAGYDIIIAAAVLHHLRDDDNWELVFRKIFRLTAPGGSVWITDLVFHGTEQVQATMWVRYGNIFNLSGGEEYRENVFPDIEKEDSPRSVTYQMNPLKKVGFAQVELLHKNSCFAAFGAVKGLEHEKE